MADITMCQNQECPINSKCYRYTAKPFLWQSYFMEKYTQATEKGCPFYLEINTTN